MKPLEFKIFHHVESYDRKPAETCKKIQLCREAYSFQTIKDVDLKFKKNNFMTWMKI